ncbi:MAG: redoxin domain-containing protein, partial [Bacteroidetes bacterium]|nr:redoxin domain-containing protein [Bacteroidota bacterium]
MIRLFICTRQAILYGILAMFGFACAQAEQSPQRVESLFEGTLSIRPEIDPSTDYRDFEVLVARDSLGEPDTLGYAITDSMGYFSMRVNAPRRGVYRLVISRLGQIQASSQMAIADGDSASLVAAFPLRSRNLRVRSPENASLQAYQNTRAQHEQSLLELVQGGNYEEDLVRNRVLQTTMILWDLKQNFPNSMGGELAAAEAIMMGTGWEDSLVVVRMQQLPSSNQRYGDAARAARQAEARRNGQSAALTLLDNLAERAQTAMQRAEIASEQVIAHIDSMEFDAAIARTNTMQEEFADTQWAIWAGRARYEIQNLLPGMKAPVFTVRDVNGDSLRIRDLLGKYVILEFYQPEDELYQRELPGRNDIIDVAGADRLEIVSISMQPDTLVNEGFFEDRVVPGRHVYGGQEVAQKYNINVLPTRYLID